MRQYHIGQIVIPYEIDWERDRETISLSMDESMELTVCAPMTATLDDIETVLDDKQSWLMKTFYGLEKQANSPRDKEYMSGEKLVYRGRHYYLDVETGDVPEPQLSFDGDRFILTVHERDKPSDEVSVRRKRQAVEDWYYRQAEDDLPKRVDRYAPKLGAEGVTIAVCDLSRAWGEYEDESIRLHWRLVRAPVRIQDYVAVHELAHAKYDDHSAGFWNAVGSVIPDYEDRREWLRLNGPLLTG
ncbi:hypothetical protein SAMN05444342_4226 [Haladaptatus paucihalophilus DX253]|nr:hypothetical protein SAMN05444342_4226 [Haladaptatus paucihalophilus DX253]